MYMTTVGGTQEKKYITKSHAEERQDSYIIHASDSTNTSLMAGCFIGVRLNSAHIRAHAHTHMCASQAKFTVNTVVKGG